MRSKIYYDLEKSTFVFNYNDFDFYFSSLFYYNKFASKCLEFASDEKLKFHYKYILKLEDNFLFFVDLYTRIEKRGFLIKYKGEDIRHKKIKIEFI